jgi:putative hydrolase of the HAD superfamily
MRQPGSYSHLVFDLDDTLYPRQAGLMQEIGRRITLWVEREFEFSPDQARALRNRYLTRYGTTLAGLIAEHNVDIDGYLAFVHDIPVSEFVQPSPDLNSMLEGISLRRSVFTNATAEHAWRVLRALGAEGMFEPVIGIREVGLFSKPHPEAYRRLLELLDTAAESCILVDDRVANLQPAKEMGMTTVLVDGHAEDGVDYAISSVLEVGELVRRLAGGGRD